MFTWIAKLFKRKQITQIIEPISISITINGITYTESITMMLDSSTVNFNKKTGNVEVAGPKDQVRKSEIIIAGSIYGDLDVTNCNIEVYGDINGDVTAVRSGVFIEGKIDGNLSATNSYVKVDRWVSGYVDVYEE